VKCGARVALGVAGGYLLGRTKKMKLALMLGGMAAGRRAGGPRELLSQGSKLLDASPELSRIVGDVRGRLLEAGKDAAMAVAVRQVEALTDRVGKRVESLGRVGEPRREAEEEPEAEPNPEDEYAQDGDGQGENAQEPGSATEQDEEPAEEQAPPPRRRRAPAKATAARTGKSASASATVRRTASGAGKSAGRNPARAARTRRSNGDG
jgi:hypothetical protein